MRPNSRKFKWSLQLTWIITAIKFAGGLTRDLKIYWKNAAMFDE